MKTKRLLLIFGIVIGAVLMLGPFLGLLGSVAGMQRVARELGRPGINDPQIVAEEIGFVMSSTLAGVIAFPIGLLIAGTCTVLLILDHSKRPPPLPPGDEPTANPPPLPK